MAKQRSDFYYWIVGLDLFDDELGYSYCPFVSWPFIKYIRERRTHDNASFGLRIHCGENVLYADGDVGAYRHFIAHMYIVFRCLSFLQRKLKKSIRVGHGIVFARILSGNMSKSMHRKSSILLADMYYHAEYILRHIAFEVNITSNECLLGDALRGDDYQNIILGVIADCNMPIILSTDDDGIWPIDHCASKHPGHHPLVAEYCRAFSSSLIESPTRLNEILQNTKRFCFSSLQTDVNTGSTEKQTLTLFHDDNCASTIIFHPDVIMALLDKYDSSAKTNCECYTYYSSRYPKKPSVFSHYQNPQWKAICESSARFAFFFFYTKECRNALEDYRAEYNQVFGTDPSIEAIQKIWNDVWHQFMNPDDAAAGRYIPKNPSEGPVFLSERSHEMQTLPCYSDYMKHNHQSNHIVHVFTRAVTESAMRINSGRKRSTSCDALARVFSTEGEEEWVESCAQGLNTIEINMKPEQRTNSFHQEEQHVVYVVCRHASAATAYLHYFGRKFAELRFQPAEAVTNDALPVALEDDTPLRMHTDNSLTSL